MVGQPRYGKMQFITVRNINYPALRISEQGIKKTPSLKVMVFFIIFLFYFL